MAYTSPLNIRDGTKNPSSEVVDGGDTSDMEMSSKPLEDDIMQLARLGEIGSIQKLFQSGKCDATYKDEQGVTPLHWAAIKNHYALCHFLIQSGADLNAKGGDVSATPILWAARSCNYYIVNLLLQHGADPLRTDDQGFNLIQNATLDGNVYQLLLLLLNDVPIDTPDPSGHTSLMWAAYKGFPACVEVLLQWGASTSATDEKGFTALHWALVKGSTPCVQKLVEYGSDKNAITSEGKSPQDVAQEMNASKQWQTALSNCGYNPDATPKVFPLAFLTNDRRLFYERFCFLWPFVILPCVVYIISGMPIFVGFPLGIFVFFIMQLAAHKMLIWAPPNMQHIHQTSFMAGIFAATLFWVGVQWLFRILPQTFFISPFMNIFFGVLYSLCTYFYALTALEDPGYIPKSRSKSDQKVTVQELIDANIFDENHFCIICMVRKPLRSKHCKRCGRCVAKTDHHCPWVFNCVANNNHRHFFLYILFLECGVLILIRLALIYVDSLPQPQLTTCNVISDNLCAILNKDPFTVVTIIWAALQLTWVTMLLLTQLIQVARAQTTYENMKGHTHMSGAGAVVTSALVAGTTSLEGAQLTSQGAGPEPPGSRPVHQHREGCFERWKKLLGVDTFIATAMYGSRAEEIQARHRSNIFTRGVITNCSDFFCDPAPVFGKRENGIAMLGGQKVDYTTMYQPPARTTVRMTGNGDHGGQYASLDTDDSV